jgi:succinate dehydrogenase / fumarate reductase flavoprotein subunit
VPDADLPAVHYTMGGLWVDYNLMSNVPGLFVLGEANFSDHGANRLGASALMQGLADGYFVIPYTVGGYLATQKPAKVGRRRTPSSRKAEANVRRPSRRPPPRGQGQASPSAISTSASGHIMWHDTAAWRATGRARRGGAPQIPALREEFWANVNVPAPARTLNQSLERAGRVADFLELGELMCRDALTREESCGGHFREEHQYPDGECKRDDVNFATSPRGNTRARASRSSATSSP